MSGKRFIKLQMAKGYNRNGAVTVRAHGKIYAAVNAQDWLRGAVVRLADSLTPALEVVVAAFREVLAGGDDDAPAS